MPIFPDIQVVSSCEHLLCARSMFRHGVPVHMEDDTCNGCVSVLTTPRQRFLA